MKENKKRGAKDGMIMEIRKELEIKVIGMEEKEKGLID